MAKICRSNVYEVNRLYEMADDTLPRLGMAEVAYSGVVGVLLNPADRARERLSTPHRDMLAVTATSLVVMSPWSPAEFETAPFDAPGGVVEAYWREDPVWGMRRFSHIPRGAVTDIKRTQSAPDGFTVSDFGGAALSLVRVEVAEGSGYDPVDFWLDPHVQSRGSLSDAERMSGQEMEAVSREATEHLNNFFTTSVPAFLKHA